MLENHNMFPSETPCHPLVWHTDQSQSASAVGHHLKANFPEENNNLVTL